MARDLKMGESLFIPFRNGKSIYDSQCKPRMYKTVKAFEKSFPGHYLRTVGVELVEYAPVVRCKDCKKGHPELAPNGGVWCAVWNHVFSDGGFCCKGERRTDDR